VAGLARGGCNKERGEGISASVFIRRSGSSRRVIEEEEEEEDLLVFNDTRDGQEK
jgi:hypothetical protein